MKLHAYDKNLGITPQFLKVFGFCHEEYPNG